MKLDANAFQHAGEQATIGFQEGTVGFFTATDIEDQLVLISEDVDQYGKKALPAFVEGYGNPLAVFDQAAQLEKNFAASSQGAAFDIFVGV